MNGVNMRLANVSVPRFLLVRYASRAAARKKERFSIKPAYDPSAIALRHMDNFYAQIFRPRLWRSIRLALHAPPKRVALLNNFATNRDGTAARLRELGCVGMEDILRYSLSASDQGRPGRRKEEEKSVQPAEVASAGGVDKSAAELDRLQPFEKPDQVEQGEEDEEDARWRVIMPGLDGMSSSLLMQFVPATELKTSEEREVSEEDYFKAYPADVAVADSVPVERLPDLRHFQVFARTRGDVVPMPDPWVDAAGVFSHAIVDAADILPVKALEMRPGDRVLYLALGEVRCLLPIIQSMLPESVTVFTLKAREEKDIRTQLSRHLTSLQGLEFVDGDLSFLQSLGQFDGVFVEPSCTVDRSCVTSDEDNMFHISRTPERVNLPHVQAEFLHAGLNRLVDGGKLVYTTSSLSPVQNDGVILAVLQRLADEGVSQTQFRIRDMHRALKDCKNMFRMIPSENKLGTVIAPYLPDNYGPKYFARIDKMT